MNNFIIFILLFLNLGLSFLSTWSRPSAACWGSTAKFLLQSSRPPGACSKERSTGDPGTDASAEHQPCLGGARPSPSGEQRLQERPSVLASQAHATTRRRLRQSQRPTTARGQGTSSLSPWLQPMGCSRAEGEVRFQLSSCLIEAN